MIREANIDDFDGLINLYTHLHNNPIPDKTLSYWCFGSG